MMMDTTWTQKFMCNSIILIVLLLLGLLPLSYLQVLSSRPNIMIFSIVWILLDYFLGKSYKN